VLLNALYTENKSILLLLKHVFPIPYKLQFKMESKKHLILHENKAKNAISIIITLVKLLLENTNTDVSL
jgi:hypothetical protein